MRPNYENELDRLREARVASYVAAWYDQQRGGEMVTARRCRRYYPCDWLLVEETSKPVVFGLLEIKVREQQYGDYMLSLGKASQIVHMAGYAGLLPMLAVYWQDIHKIGIVDLGGCSRECVVGGRTDRGDKDDIEPVIYIPNKDFFLIPTELGVI